MAKAPVKTKEAPVAETQVVENETQTQAVTVIPNTGTAVALADDDLDLGADAGIGTEGIGKDDMALPFLSILQDLSPQTKKSKAEFVEGAKPGMFYNSVTKQFWDGEKGIPFVPASYQKTYIEWVPNQGGFVADHGEAAGKQLAETGKRTEKGELMLPNGNQLVETAYVFGIVPGGKWGEADDGAGNKVPVWEFDGTANEVLLTAKSSGLKTTRTWNTQMMGVKVPVQGRMITPALAFNLYLLKAKEVSNDQGTWFALEPTRMGNTPQIPEHGKNFYRQAVEFAKLMAKTPRPIVNDTALSEGPAGEQGEVSKAF
jgi:hypothetical protein